MVILTSILTQVFHQRALHHIWPLNAVGVTKTDLAGDESRRSKVTLYCVSSGGSQCHRNIAASLSEKWALPDGCVLCAS
jgi:hypothetical protein